MFQPVAVHRGKKQPKQHAICLEDLLVAIRDTEKEEMIQNLHHLTEDILHIYGLVHWAYEENDWGQYATEKKFKSWTKKSAKKKVTSFCGDWLPYVLSNCFVIHAFQKYGDPSLLSCGVGTPYPYEEYTIAAIPYLDPMFEGCGKRVYLFQWTHYKNGRSCYIRFWDPFLGPNGPEDQIVNSQIRMVQKETREGYRFLIGLSEKVHGEIQVPTIQLMEWEYEASKVSENGNELYLGIDRGGSIHCGRIENPHLMVEMDSRLVKKKRRDRLYYKSSNVGVWKFIPSPSIVDNKKRNYRRYYLALVMYLIQTFRPTRIRFERTINENYTIIFSRSVSTYYEEELATVERVHLEYFQDLLQSVCHIMGVCYENENTPGERAICCNCGKSSKITSFLDAGYVCGPRGDGRCGNFSTHNRILNLLNHMINHSRGVAGKVNPSDMAFPLDLGIYTSRFMWDPSNPQESPLFKEAIEKIDREQEE